MASWSELASRVSGTLQSGLREYIQADLVQGPTPSAPPLDELPRVSEDPKDVEQVLRQRGRTDPNNNANVNNNNNNNGGDNSYFGAYAAAEPGARAGLGVRADACACGISLEPKQMAQHVRRCPRAIAPCEFASFGCRARMPRSERPVHNRKFFDYHRELLTAAGSVYLKPSNSPQRGGTAKRGGAGSAVGGTASSQPGRAAQQAQEQQQQQQPDPDRRPRDAPPGMSMEEPSDALATTNREQSGLLVSPEARAELFHNTMAVFDATEEFLQKAAASGSALAEQHLHADNANMVLRQANLFLTTDKIHPLGKVAVVGTSLLLAKGVVFMLLRWFVLGFLMTASYQSIDRKFPRIPESLRANSEVLAINERRTVALAGYAALSLWLFVTIF